MPLGNSFSVTHSGTVKMNLRTIAKCLKTINHVTIVSMASSTGLWKLSLLKQSTDLPKHVDVIVSRPRQRKPDERSEDWPAVSSLIKTLQNFSICGTDIRKSEKRGEVAAYILLDHPFTCKDRAFGEEWM